MLSVYLYTILSTFPPTEKKKLQLHDELAENPLPQWRQMSLLSVCLAVDVAVWGTMVLVIYGAFKKVSLLWQLMYTPSCSV